MELGLTTLQNSSSGVGILVGVAVTSGVVVVSPGQTVTGGGIRTKADVVVSYFLSCYMDVMRS
jgi:hypothetical protein